MKKQITVYSFKKGLGKGIIAFCLFAIPILSQALPSDILNLTIGGLLIMLLNFLKVNYRNI